jgi:probable rRNA maturation factor
VPMNRITFHSEGYRMPKLKKHDLKRWLIEIAQNHDKQIVRLAYNFCSDAELLKINQEFLQHDTLTDIITFDYSNQNLLEGEIFISHERIAENANHFQQEFMHEFLRVLVHVLLHLIGFQDKTKKLKQEMRQKENEAIQHFFTILAENKTIQKR